MVTLLGIAIALLVIFMGVMIAFPELWGQIFPRQYVCAACKKKLELAEAEVLSRRAQRELDEDRLAVERE